MKIVSIDIGIKNLSFCLFEIGYNNNIKILKWDNINLGEKVEFKCIEIDKNGFTEFKAAGKTINPGPFYLVWKKFETRTIANYSDDLKWTSQLKSVYIIK